MKKKEYRATTYPKLKRDWKYKKIRTTAVLKNGWGEIPIGSIGYICYQGPKGSNLSFKTCVCCGLKASINQVSQDKFEFIELLDSPA